MTEIVFIFILDTWRRDVKSGDIKTAINEAAPDKLKPLHVSEVPLIPFCRIYALAFKMLLVVTVIYV